MSKAMKRWDGLPTLFNLGETAHSRLFAYLDWPWESLSSLDGYLDMLLAEDALVDSESPIMEGVRAQGDVRVGPRTRIEPGVVIEGVVHIGADCVVESGAYIRGPAWIGDHCEIRQGAYLRGVVLAADGAVLGHACEFKRCIILEGAQAPHFNYVGDSIMGVHAHIGAGVILSNVRLDKKHVRTVLLSAGSTLPGVSDRPEIMDTGLEKFGAILGDSCEVGCNSVLNPGTILGARCRAAPLSRVKGTWPEDSIIA